MNRCLKFVEKRLLVSDQDCYILCCVTGTGKRKVEKGWMFAFLDFIICVKWQKATSMSLISDLLIRFSFLSVLNLYIFSLRLDSSDSRHLLVLTRCCFPGSVHIYYHSKFETAQFHTPAAPNGVSKL